MKFYIPVIIVIPFFICSVSCQQNNDTQPVNIEIPEQNNNDSLNTNRILFELVDKISSSSIYKEYDSLQNVLNFEKRIAYDEYMITRKQNNNAEIISLLNNNNMALAKKREDLLKLGFKLSYEYERVSISMVLIKTKLLNTFPELLTMNATEQEHVLQLVTEKKSKAIISPI